MHDTDEHYADERQTHDTRMEYVKKRHDILTARMCKLSRSIFKKIEVMQARHHMKDATNITLPS